MFGFAKILIEFNHALNQTFLHQTKPIFIPVILSTNMVFQNKYSLLSFVNHAQIPQKRGTWNYGKNMHT
jgi:hypothetical protein